MKKLFFLAVMLIALLIMPTADALAQGLRFEVPKVDMNVFILDDASARIVYDIEFENVRGQPITIVDIGLPHKKYDRNSIKASMNGVPVTSFQSSKNVEIGVTAVLGKQAIPVGGSGNFHFEITVRDMVFQDETNDDLASFQITPTWFGSQYVIGSTELTILVNLPPDINPDDVLYHKAPFTNKYVEDGTVVAGWHYASTRFVSAHMVGLSFPKAAISRIVTETWVDRFAKSGGFRFLSAVLFLVVFGVFFFRFTGGTGIVVFIPFVVVFIVIAVVNPTLHLILWPVLLVAGTFSEWRLRKRRSSYLPPIMTVEGGGVKQGFTAAEAAILLELPLAKVVSIIVAGLLKKGVLGEVIVNDEQFFQVAPEFLSKNHTDRRKAASDLGIVLHKYEQNFLDSRIALGKDTFKIEDIIDLNDVLKKMIESVATRMNNYDLKETRRHYRAIVDSAWAEVESLKATADRNRAIEERFEWLALDDKVDQRTEKWRADGYFFNPAWLLYYRSYGLGRGGAFGWIGATSGGVQDRISVAPAGGIVSLRGIDTATGDALRTIGEGLAESGGGGGGGGCACACAGCACACACAGGGA